MQGLHLLHGEPGSLGFLWFFPRGEKRDNLKHGTDTQNNSKDWCGHREGREENKSYLLYKTSACLEVASSPPTNCSRELAKVNRHTVALKSQPWTRGSCQLSVISNVMLAVSQPGFISLCQIVPPYWIHLPDHFVKENIGVSLAVLDNSIKMICFSCF